MSTFRTTKINLVFEAIAAVKNISEGNKNKQGGVNFTLSMLVGLDRQSSNLIIKNLEQIRKLSELFETV